MWAITLYIVLQKGVHDFSALFAPNSDTKEMHSKGFVGVCNSLSNHVEMFFQELAGPNINATLKCEASPTSKALQKSLTALKPETDHLKAYKYKHHVALLKHGRNSLTFVNSGVNYTREPKSLSNLFYRSKTYSCERCQRSARLRCEEKMAVDEVLKRSGDFGPVQWCLLSLFSVVNVFSAFHYFAQTFISLAPAEEDCKGQNRTSNYSLKLVQKSYYKWEFETLTTELNWVCEEKWKLAVVQSTFFIGSIVGTFVLGILADSFGRRPMLIVANLLAVLGNLLTVYLEPTIFCLSLGRFTAGLATDTNFFMMYIIVMEYIKPGMRTFGLNLCIGIWYCVGCMLTPWLAVASKTWRHFLLAISVPTLLIPISCLIVPESAQWLLSVGRTDDAIECFVKIAKFNGKQISAEFLENFKASADKNKITHQKSNLWGLFKTPRLRRKTCILIFKTVVLTLCYDAMSRNIEGLGLNPFTVFTITSASIFPSCVVILLFQDRVGRKAMAVFALLMTGLFNFGQGAILVFCKDLMYVVVLVGLLGRFSVNVAYNSGTQYAAELIPTQVRGQGLAAMHVLGYSAAFFSPHVLYMANFWVATPEFILGTLSLAGAAFCLFLPETLNKSLPCTLDDGEVFGENEKVFDFLKKRQPRNEVKVSQ